MRRVGYPNLGYTGRLGNQLFQVAATLGFARARGVDPVFPESWPYRPWFSFPDAWFVPPERSGRVTPAELLVTDLPPQQRPYLQLFALVEPVLDEMRSCLHLSEHGEQVLARHIDGYDWAVPADAVSVHVRRGDNTNPHTHPVGSWPLVTQEFYRAAVGRFPDLTPVVFSDDPVWCADHLDLGRPFLPAPPSPVRPPEYEDRAAYDASPALDWIDLILMSRCSAHVTANSSYSTWAALLSGNPTVYPDNWVGYLRRDSIPPLGKMLPPTWTRLPNPVPTEHLSPC